MAEPNISRQAFHIRIGSDIHYLTFPQVILNPYNNLDCFLPIPTVN